jgi:hypothetical protein
LLYRSDLVKGIGTGAASGANTKKLLDGIAQFVKAAQGWEATLTLLSHLEGRTGAFAAPAFPLGRPHGSKEHAFATRRSQCLSSC